MDATRRILRLRRVAGMASLAALLLPAGQAEAAHHAIKAPVITSVRPMNVQVGQTLTLHGHGFRKGKARNSVAFRSAGAPAVFVRSGISTTRMLEVKVPAKLVKYMANTGTSPLATRFHLRVLASRFSRRFTSSRLSPTVRPTGAPKSGSASGGERHATFGQVPAPFAGPNWWALQ